MTKTSVLEQPKQKKQPTKQSAQPTMNAADDSLRLFQAADECLMGAARDGRTYGNLTPGEFLLCQRLNWDKSKIRHELAVRAEIIRQRQAAATESEREAAHKQLEAATDKLNTEGGALKAELERITNEINGKICVLESDVAAKQSVVTTHQNAINRLRQMVPEHIRHESEAAVASAKREFSKRINQLAIEIDQADSIAEFEVGTINGNVRACHYIKAKGLDNLLQPADSDAKWLQPKINLAAWRQHVDELQEKLPSLREEYRQLIASEARAVRV